MSDEIKKDRSPNYPKLPLEQAVALTTQLYGKIGKAKVKPQVAIGPLGYTGLHGASLTTLGAVSAYGLLERERGESVSVSALAIKLIHPTDDVQGLEAKRMAALRPKVFAELFSGGYHLMQEEVLSNHLIQQGFTPDGAKKAASVFKANVLFAKLDEPGIVNPNDEKAILRPEAFTMESTANPTPAATRPSPLSNILDDFLKGSGPTKGVLAKYSIPLGTNEATLVITGESLSTEDFDALGEYVALFKKQFDRKGASKLQDGAANPVGT